MSKYMVQKDKYSGNIVYMEYDLEGYSFKPKTTHDKPYISVNSVTIYEPKMIDNLLSKKFYKKFERLSQIIINFLFQDDTDDDEGDFMILLDEVARLKSIVELKYQKFLSNQEYKDYIHKLDFLDSQLRQKIAIVNYRKNLDYEINRGGRSR